MAGLATSLRLRPALNRLRGLNASHGQGGGGLYLGPVGTRGFINNSIVVDTSGWNSRTPHIARDDITALQVLDWNGYVIPGTGETDPNNIKTLTRSVEYPANTFKQIKWSGASSIAMASKALALSDPCAIAIPRGSLYWLNQWQTNSRALCFSIRTLRKKGTAAGERISHTSTDQTMTGVIDDGSSNDMIPTMAVLGMTRRPTIGVAVGSSRMCGQADTVDAMGDTGYARLFGQSFGYIDLSVGGDTLEAVLGPGGAIRRQIINQYCSNEWVDPGLNSLNSLGTTGAAALALITNHVDTGPFGRGKTIINNEAPWTTSTDGFITTVNQGFKSWEAEREVLNAGINAFTDFNQIVHANEFMRVSPSIEKWKNPVDGGFQFVAPDGAHELNPALLAFVASGAFNPALVMRG